MVVLKIIPLALLFDLAFVLATAGSSCQKDTYISKA
jgi:hypothetical protein